MLKLYNTLTRKKEVFKPLHDRQVGLYTCGPTVYKHQHIGNYRTYIMEDILQKTLEYNGYKVKRVLNITDVGHLTSDADTGEDKIEKEAKKEKKSVRDIANFYTNAFLKDIEKLHIKKPEIIVKASETIDDQIRIIRKLFEKGFAYETPQAVYFDVSKFKNYGKLSGQSLSQKITAARDEVVEDKNKKNPVDFTLWFKRVGKFKNHIMHWPSPWGQGFPGWHIECSAISTKYLGQPFDIHAGGVDHIGTHHTNEIAQSEAAFGKPMARYWLHGEFLLVDRAKMAKSEGNFITLATLAEKGFDPLAFRYLILTSHYKSKLNFSWKSLEAAQHALRNLKEAIAAQNIKAHASEKQKIKHYEGRFLTVINDDLNTPKTLSMVWEIAKDNGLSKQTKHGLLLKFDGILGLDLGKVKAAKIPRGIRVLAEKREAFRRNKQFIKADVLRKQIKKLGYIVQDTAFGPKVRRNS